MRAIHLNRTNSVQEGRIETSELKISGWLSNWITLRDFVVSEWVIEARFPPSVSMWVTSIADAWIVQGQNMWLNKISSWFVLNYERGWTFYLLRTLMCLKAFSPIISFSLFCSQLWKSWYYVWLDDCLGAWEVFDSTLLAGHSGYIPTHQDFNNALLRPAGTCYNMQAGQSRGWVWQDFITPQGVLGCRAAKGSPSPGHSPSPEVTQEEHPGPDGAGYLIHSNVIACGEGQLDIFLYYFCFAIYTI